jgi:hypothetical protein
LNALLVTPPARPRTRPTGMPGVRVRRATSAYLP